METTTNYGTHCKVQYGNDYRRFLFTGGNFSAFIAQTTRLFKLEENLLLKYKDDEGDLVTISSDEELAFAIELFEGEILRLTLEKPNPDFRVGCEWKRRHCFGRGHFRPHSEDGGRGGHFRPHCEDGGRGGHFRPHCEDGGKGGHFRPHCEDGGKGAFFRRRWSNKMNDPEFKDRRKEKLTKKLQYLTERLAALDSDSITQQLPAASLPEPVEIQQLPQPSVVPSQDSTRADFHLLLEKRRQIHGNIHSVCEEMRRKQGEIKALRCQFRVERDSTLKDRIQQLKTIVDALANNMAALRTELRQLDVKIGEARSCSPCKKH